METEKLKNIRFQMQQEIDSYPDQFDKESFDLLLKDYCEEHAQSLKQPTDERERLISFAHHWQRETNFIYTNGTTEELVDKYLSQPEPIGRPILFNVNRQPEPKEEQEVCKDWKDHQSCKRWVKEEDGCESCSLSPIKHL